jgi:hypothetical protein
MVLMRTTLPGTFLESIELTDANAWCPALTPQAAQASAGRNRIPSSGPPAMTIRGCLVQHHAPQRSSSSTAATACYPGRKMKIFR